MFQDSRRLRQEDPKFEASLDCKERPYISLRRGCICSSSGWRSENSLQESVLIHSGQAWHGCPVTSPHPSWEQQSDLFEGFYHSHVWQIPQNF